MFQAEARGHHRGTWQRASVNAERILFSTSSAQRAEGSPASPRREDKARAVVLLALLSVLLVVYFLKFNAFSDENDAEPVAAYSHRGKLNSTGHVYVCITGQLSRLELHNKIQTLLNPLNDMGYSLFIGLALSEGGFQFSNNNSGAKMKLKESISRVINELENVQGVKEVKYFPPNFDDLKFNAKYDKILGNYTELDNNNRVIQLNYLSNQPVLAANNARQFKTLQYCNSWPGLEEKTDFLLRVREDVLIFKVDFPRILQLLEEGVVVTSQCDAWRGINDKLAFAPSTRASDFFNVPYREYLKFDNKYHKVEKLNAETLYKIAYLKHGFKLKRTKSLVATKAMTFFNNESSDSNNCTVVGNPFLLSLSKYCPRGSLDRMTYKAVCWQ